VRYVNAEESPGSISLAVDPSAIGTIQTLRLPQDALAPNPPAHVVEEAVRLGAEIDAAHAEMPANVSGLRIFQARQTGDDEEAVLADECEDRIIAAWSTLEEQLEGGYLVGVGPMVRQQFTDANGSLAARPRARGHGDSEWLPRPLPSPFRGAHTGRCP
jgi:hypothetical protein